MHPLKQWLRRNPGEVPHGLDAATSTSHQLRNGLRRLGWTLEETPDEVRLIAPGAAASTRVIEEILGSADEGEPEEERLSSFSLENQLRDFLAHNLSSIPIGGRRLRLFVDASGRDAVEFTTGGGRIDILATDADGSFFVFELKRARSPDAVVGQLARYMGWVQQTVGRGKKVFGIIVAQEIGVNLRYAASIIPNVELFEYKVSFQLQPAQEIGSLP